MPTWDLPETVRTANTADAIAQAILDNLYFVQARVPEIATLNDRYMAVAYTIRDRLLKRWISTAEAYWDKDERIVGYLSAEYLLGPHLRNNCINLGVLEAVQEAVAKLGMRFDEIVNKEEEPGLGNGGLGRLAACFMDSMATLDVPAIGYGIRYEFGIFDQMIRGGEQIEIADEWLRFGNPWEFRRPEICQPVGFGGHVLTVTDADGAVRRQWYPERMVKGVAHDTSIPGYRNHRVNLLRLWKAEAMESFDFQSFNIGDYLGAVDKKIRSENLTKVLYPNDNVSQGRQLRLEQQYFFVSCSLKDMIRLHLRGGRPIETFHEHWTVQMNDTHPSVAVAELMRLLMDDYRVGWDEAWQITRQALAYTNHTLLPEALEKWPLELFERLLPRHLQIIYEINRRLLDDVRARFPGDEDRVRRMSLIDEAGPRNVRMANLATAGSRAVNGVAALHSELVKSEVLRDFHEMYPERFCNVTNGVTQRRWMVLANPRLTGLIGSRIGEGWIRNLEELRKLEPLAEDAEFRAAWRAVKLHNKRVLAEVIERRAGVKVDPASLFDVQVKRFHEYKRQHLNVLHVITLYNRLKRDPACEGPARTVVFAGKAAPGYFMAKLIIRLIHSVGDVVNNDPAIGGRLKVAFVPDFNVKHSEPIYPAADLSEQISTAGKEASGTGNMKFSMNGALTIGTLDGANIEIREEVGAENFFLFGNTVEELAAIRAAGYRPREHYDRIPELREALDQLQAGHFSRGDRGLFKPLVDKLLDDDYFMLLADYQSYVDTQAEVGAAYLDTERWCRMSILNAARMGKFSSDRSNRDYCRLIWGISAAD
jgi:starch phosphorylase